MYIHRIVLSAGMIFLWYTLHGQNRFAFSGSVTDENNHTLAGATVYIPATSQGTITNLEGRFSFAGLQAGRYRFEVSYLGYALYADTLALTGDTHLEIRLSPECLTLHEVEITDSHAHARNRNSSQPVEVVNSAYLRQNLGGSLMQSLERLPGVSTVDIGSGQSKPVIRGLGFNRVVVAENGTKHEGQQWGADHGLEIDQFAADHVEIVLGPASLQYGSDAIGGVVDIKNSPMPAEHSISGSIDLAARSNNAMYGGSAGLSVRKVKLAMGVRGSYQSYADYRVPTDTVDIYGAKIALNNQKLRNTAGNEQAFQVWAGYIGTHLKSRLYFSHYQAVTGFFANAHGIEPLNVDNPLHDGSARDIQLPYHKVEHTKLQITNNWQKGHSLVRADFGLQYNHRYEHSTYTPHGYKPAVYTDTLPWPSELELELGKYTLTGKLGYAIEVQSNTSIDAGVSAEYQHNSIGGHSFIIPAFRQWTAGVYLIGRHTFANAGILRGGLRYDRGTIQTQKYTDWYPGRVITGSDTTWQYLQRAEHLNPTFGNISGGIGYVWSPGHFNFKVNLGKSFRMPDAKELAANGVNYHHFSYEKGKPDLQPESAWQLDVGAEYHQPEFVVGITPYGGYFSNYIFLNPTPYRDYGYGAGQQVFEYTQSEVIRAGGELHAHVKLYGPLTLGIIGEYVYARQLNGAKAGFPLPFSPPASGLLNLKYKTNKVKWAKDLWASADYRLAAAQNQVMPPEQQTSGYQLVNLSAGGTIGKNWYDFSIAIQVNNLFDTRYFNHSSYYRLINVPEAGRNFTITISMPFLFTTNTSK